MMRVVTVAPHRRVRVLTSSPAERQRAHLEGLGLAAAAIVVVFGLWLAARQHAPVFEEARAGLASGAIVNVSRVADGAPLTRALSALESEPQRRATADAILTWKAEHGAPTHIGALSSAVSELSAVKPALIVRSEGEYRSRLWWSVLLLLTAFAVIHGIRRFMGRVGDPVLLPAVLLLAGLSVMAMISMRDPLRDTEAAIAVIHGAIYGCIALAALAFVDFENPRFKRSTIVPFAAAVILAAALLVFGSGPGTSGAKVNLLGMQPIEVIRLLAVFALASYFARRWEQLREISQPVGPAPIIRRRFTSPRAQDVQPLAIIVGTLLVFFVLQKDLGPALVLGAMALALYGVARSRSGLVLAGFAVLIAGFAAGYWLGIPSTIARRVAMWIDPWHNGLVGGDQIAHAQWAMATGAFFGLGPGLGDGQLIPAGHTDLIAAALGEEVGFIGLAVVAALYVLIIWRITRIALRAPGDYTMFLALGCALSLSVPAIVIAGGLLGLLPLSGVVTPFLSYGKSSMICNMAAVGIAMAIAARGSRVRPAFTRQVRTLTAVLGVFLVLLVGRIAWVQVIRADDTAVRPSLVRQADGGARYQYNPRLLMAARMIPRGTIFDRRGLTLAVNDPDKAKPMFDRLMSIRAGTASACDPAVSRCYPLGGYAFHVLGDAVRQTNWAARNASFVERDAAATLQGYDDRPDLVQVTLPDGSETSVIAHDYRGLLPLVRNKTDLDDPDVKRLLTANHDVTLTLDGPLQALVARSLETRVRAAKSSRGAAVVLNADTGEVLASVSYPWPEVAGSATITTDELLDRARFGLYPPGSTFKLITAAAALSTAAPDRLPSFRCERLPDGRIGAEVRGLGRPIRDDVLDHEPHGMVDLRRGLVVSCNAYFARLAMHMGAEPLARTASTANIQAAMEPVIDRLTRTLPYAGYGQGEVLARPIRMARVAAAIAGDGTIRDASLVKDAASPTAVRWLAPQDAALLRGAMRDVVTSGTGRSLAAHAVPISGKTGTAEVAGAASHSWFVGFAPTGSQGGRIAFAVIIENGGYGGRSAAAAAGDIVSAARTVGVIR